MSSVCVRFFFYYYYFTIFGNDFRKLSFWLVQSRTIHTYIIHRMLNVRRSVVCTRHSDDIRSVYVTHFYYGGTVIISLERSSSIIEITSQGLVDTWKTNLVWRWYFKNRCICNDRGELSGTRLGESAYGINWNRTGSSQGCFSPWKPLTTQKSL